MTPTNFNPFAGPPPNPKDVWEAVRLKMKAMTPEELRQLGEMMSRPIIDPPSRPWHALTESGERVQIWPEDGNVWGDEEE